MGKLDKRNKLYLINTICEISNLKLKRTSYITVPSARICRMFFYLLELGLIFRVLRHRSTGERYPVHQKRD